MDYSWTWTATQDTKTKLIEAYDLNSWQIDRVNRERTTYIPRACLGVFGTIQPRVLSQAFDDLDAASGFLPRFIIIHSTKTGPTLWNDVGIGDEIREKWEHYVSALASYELEPCDEDRFKSRLTGLSEEAKTQYIAWYNQLAMEPWTNVTDGVFKAIVPKMQEQALRICLILHCLESVAAGRKETLPVQGDTMNRALKIADWVWSHQKRAWLHLNRNTEGSPAPLEKRIASAIIELDGEIEKGFLETKKITEKLNQGLEEQYHVSAKSVGHVCAKKLKLHPGPNKNRRGWMITSDTIVNLKSIYGLTAKRNALNALNAQNPHQTRDAEDSIYFSAKRNALNAQMEKGRLKNKCPKCPRNAQASNPHQSRDLGIRGISGVYLPSIPESELEDLGAGCSDTDENLVIEDLGSAHNFV
ncbi:MAG: DUF3987 domain-containing protein [Nitrospiraceae bacterium]|nr:DUF3987 domain-containing protein [Nitrospiraceae bacterium]